MRHGTMVVLMAVLVTEAGCGLFADRIPLGEAILRVDEDVRGAAIHQSSYMVSDDYSKRQIVADQLLEFQCYFGTNDPEIPLLAGAWSLALQGSFSTSVTPSAGFQGPVPTGSLQFGVTKGRMQTLTVPIVYTPISRISLAYMQQTLSYYNGLSDMQKKPVIEKLMQDVTTMQAVATEVIARYPGDFQRCPDGSPQPLRAATTTASPIAVPPPTGIPAPTLPARPRRSASRSAAQSPEATTMITKLTGSGLTSQLTTPVTVPGQIREAASPVPLDPQQPTGKVGKPGGGLTPQSVQPPSADK